MKYFIGIDPGLQGAISLLREDGKLEDLYDTPILTVKKGKGKKHLYNTPEMVRILRECLEVKGECHVALENVHAMPGQGVTSMFNMGRGFGNWEGIIAALGIPMTYLEPRKWKNAMNIPSGSDKSQSCVIAMRLFPKANLLRTARSTKPSDGRADALLLAETLRRTLVASKSSRSNPKLR